MYRETEAASDRPVWLVELLDRVASLRTMVAVLGIVAVAALGVAIWALIDARNNESASTAGASVSALEDRVSNLESALDDKASRSSVADLRSQQQQIRQRVDDLDKKVSSDDTATQSLQRDVQDLKQRVDALERRQGQTP
jgi:uncharacterized protein HemX